MSVDVFHVAICDIDVPHAWHHLIALAQKDHHTRSVPEALLAEQVEAKGELGGLTEKGI